CLAATAYRNLAMARSRSFFRISLFISTGCIALAARAFPIFQAPVPVVEFYNQGTGHYFATVTAAEIADIEAGKAGHGWVRTGSSFDEYSVPVYGVCNGCVPVSRFYAPGPNSHFFTLDPVEAESLKKPGTGWNF